MASFSDRWSDGFRQWLIKTFRLGEASVWRTDEEWGKDPATYSPEEYGNYIATSVPVYACANLRAKNLAKLPLRLWKVDLNGNRKEVQAGQLNDLLKRVNPFWTLGRLIRMTELARCLWGVSYWTLERGDSGTLPPKEIWWARPDKMRVRPHHSDYLAGFIYEDLGRQIEFLPKEVIWLPMDNPIDEFAGLSPIAAARLSIDLGTAGLNSNKKLFDQGLMLGGIISPEDKAVNWTPDQTKAYEEMFSRRFRGGDKAHRWAVLSGGVKAQPLGVNPRDAEFIEQMKWSLGDVGRVYNVPPELLGDLEHATYNNLNQAYKALWTDCLLPEAAEIAECLTEQLLPMFPGVADLAEFDSSGIPALQEDRGEIVQQMDVLYRIGVPLNRLLQELMPSLLPEDGTGYPWGDEPMTKPAPALPEGREPLEETPPKTAEEGIERAIKLWQGSGFEPVTKQVDGLLVYGSAEHELVWKKFARRTERHEGVFAEMAADLFRRQKDSILARIQSGKAVKDGGSADPFNMAQWGKLFKSEALPILRAIVKEAGETTMEELDMTIDFDLVNPEAIRFLEQRAQRFARHVNKTTWNELKASLAEGMDAGESIAKLSERVEQVMAGRIRSSAETIARTEVIGASNGGALLGAKQSGVVKQKRWLAALDGRTRESHIEAHGQTVGIDDDFKVGDGAGPAPGQIGLGEEDVSCRCSLTWVV